MPFLDPNWEPRPEDKAMGRGLGRTTKMLSQVIVLAADPQHIVTLWPSRTVAQWARDYTDQLVDCELGARLRREPFENRGWFSATLWWTRIDFVPISVEPGGWIRDVKSLSILVDHSVEDMLALRSARDKSHFDYDQWQRAIKVALAINESGQTLSDLRLLLMMSR